MLTYLTRIRNVWEPIRVHSARNLEENWTSKIGLTILWSLDSNDILGCLILGLSMGDHGGLCLARSANSLVEAPVEEPPMIRGFNCPPSTLLLDPLIAPIVPRISNDNPSQDQDHHPGSSKFWEIIFLIPPGTWRSFGSSGEYARAGWEAWRRGSGGQELWRGRSGGQQESEQHCGQLVEAAGGGEWIKSRQYGEFNSIDIKYEKCQKPSFGKEWQTLPMLKIWGVGERCWWDFLIIWLISSPTSTLELSTPPRNDSTSTCGILS